MNAFDSTTRTGELVQHFVNYMQEPRNDRGEEFKGIPLLMVSIARENNNYSEIFSACIEEAKNQEYKRLERTGIFIIMLKNSKDPLVSALNEDIVFKIMNLCKEIHLISCSMLTTDVTNFQDQISVKLIQLQCRVRSEELDAKIKKLEKRAEKLETDDSFCTLF